MAKVSLRIYNREIESLIDQGHLDEAIAHCHHILHTFPKHLETYRLLGKAFLEAKHHSNAVDVFSRVLMAVPDDFVSHVGMSIVRDDEGKLDDAIWHMERAFESQPSNAAIQAELQRLFGRRDGVEPPKIRMTRGALAHMYVQGELYPQAISEIRAVLAQDPQRAEMQVLLARAYFRGGQKADASDMCSQLLKRYPYCFDANRIMVELIPGSDRAESTQVYRHRVNELDPYSIFAKESVFRTGDVTDASINLERLEYTGQSVDVGHVWESSLGIGLGSAAAASSEQPDWLKSGLPESQPALSTGSEQPPQPVSQSGQEIPDFLREAGWTESSGAAEEPAPFEATPSGYLEPATIPEWLKNQMPDESSRSEKPTEPPPGIGGTPDWLSGLGAQSEEPAKSSSEDLDWLSGLGAEKPAEEPSAPSGDVPDWLSGLGSSESAVPAEPAAAMSGDIPDWLNDLDGGKSEEPAAQPEPAPKEELMPDWLSSKSASEPKQPEPPRAEPPKAAPPSASLETLGTSAKEQDDAVAWLEMLATKHGAKQEELVTDPAARTEKPPEWVEQARSIAESQPAEEPIASQPTEDETGMWLRELTEKEPVSPLNEENQSLLSDQEVPDWLKGLESESSGEQAAPEPIAEEPVAQADLSDQFAELESEPAAPSMQEEPLDQQSALPDWLGGMQDEQAGREESPADTSGQHDISEWLSALDKEAAFGKSTSELEAQPASSERTDIPDWLRGLESSSVKGIEEEPEEFPTEPVATPLSRTEEPAPVTSAADLPEWLRGIDETKPGEPAEQARENLPSWLQEDFEEEEPHPAPVTPADWHPAEPQPKPPASEPEVEFETPQPAPKPKPAQPTVELVQPTPPPPDVRKPAPRPAPVQKPPQPVRAKQVSEAPQASLAALKQAQGELNRGDIPAAVDHYNKLIKKGKHLDETIRDLRESLYRYPVEVSIWQALGDAYMRANRLQQALDAYNKAEELLR